MHTLITPTDFSPEAHNACLYAAKTARAIHAKLLLAHVIEAPVVVTEFSDIVDMAETTGVNERLQQLLDELCLETDNEISIEAVIISGDVERELQNLCMNEKPLAVIMATHTSSAVERFFNGSTTAFMSQHLRFPVIVVPAIARFSKIKKIALAIDLKETDALPAAEIEMIVKGFNADLEIFHVSKERMHDTTPVLNVLAEVLPNVRYSLFATQNGDIPAAIYSLTRTHDIDMLMVVRKKHGLLHKSQSGDLAFHAAIPTMVLHTDDVLAKA